MIDYNPLSGKMLEFGCWVSPHPSDMSVPIDQGFFSDMGSF